MLYKAHCAILKSVDLWGDTMNQKIIGERIRYLRNSLLNISQEEFAKKIGLDRTYMSKIEAGKQNLTLETLNKICEGLGITLKELFDFDLPSSEEC